MELSESVNCQSVYQNQGSVLKKSCRGKLFIADLMFVSVFVFLYRSCVVIIVVTATKTRVNVNEFRGNST